MTGRFQLRAEPPKSRFRLTSAGSRRQDSPLPPRRHRALAGAALTALALCGCLPGYDPCFIPASIVSDLRTLAVRADPPEALIDLGADGSPTSIPIVHVRALIAGQGPGLRLRLRARLCAPTATLHCADGTPVVEGPLSDRDATEATLDVRATPALLRQSLAEDPLKGYGGIRLQLEVDGLAGNDHASLATKQLLYSPAANTPRPNQPIDLEGVDFTRLGQLDQSVGPDGTATVFVPQSYGLRPRLAALADGSSALEEYDVVDLSGRVVHLREQVTYDFFTDPALIFGDLRSDQGNPVGAYSVGSDRASEPAQGVAEPPNGLVRITPLSGADAHLWVVARDSRGAVAWSAQHVRAIDARVCDRGDGVPCATGMSCCPSLFFGCE